MSAAQLRRLADSYLRHVLVAIEHEDRGARLRDFLDPWWVFEREIERGSETNSDHSFVKRSDGGRVIRQHTFDAPCPVQHRYRLLKMDFISDRAAIVIQAGVRVQKGRDKSPLAADQRLLVDHVVPFKCLSQELFSNPELRDERNLSAFLRANYLRGVVVKAEHDGDGAPLGGELGSGMPRGWRFGDDPFARYAGVPGRRYGA